MVDPYMKCRTCNRPILFREYTDYGKQCKKCGTLVKASMALPVQVNDQTTFWKREGKDYVKAEKEIPYQKDDLPEMSLKDVRKLVHKMEQEAYQMQQLLGKIHDKMVRLVGELNK